MAIKSYVSPKIDVSNPFIVEQLLVKDCMRRKVVSLRVNQGFREAVALMIRNGVPSAPVLYPDGKVAGILSEGDILKRVSQNKYHNMPVNKMLVAELMTPNVLTVRADEKLYDLVDLFLNTRKRSFPVVEDGVFVGLISQKEVLKALFDMRFKY